MSRVLLIATFLAACGPSIQDQDDDDGVAADAGTGRDADEGPTGTVTGRVWAPGNAPGSRWLCSGVFNPH